MERIRCDDCGKWFNKGNAWIEIEYNTHSYTFYPSYYCSKKCAEGDDDDEDDDDEDDDDEDE